MVCWVGLWEVFFIFLTSLASRGAMCRIVSILVVNCCCCGSVVVVGSTGTPLGVYVPVVCPCHDVALSC